MAFSEYMNFMYWHSAPNLQFFFRSLEQFFLIVCKSKHFLKQNTYYVPLFIYGTCCWSYVFCPLGGLMWLSPFFAISCSSFSEFCLLWLWIIGLMTAGQTLGKKWLDHRILLKSWGSGATTSAIFLFKRLYKVNRLPRLSF